MTPDRESAEPALDAWIRSRFLSPSHELGSKCERGLGEHPAAGVEASEGYGIERRGLPYGAAFTRQS
jgi:hypothetical protein